MRHAALAVCACALLILAPGCGEQEDHTEVDASVLEEEEAKRAMKETEKLQQNLLDAQKQPSENSSEE
jgi:hypothetical protein